MAVRPALNHIGGAWVESSSHLTVEDRDPAHTDRVLANAAASTAADVRHAIDAAEQAFPEWRATPAPQRGDIV
ncbi:MAG TPA: aldehyde dehydrogenase family protein, partial [Candidatus Limnocylindria bacterium]